MPSELTKREKQIIELLDRSLGDAEIATWLSCPEDSLRWRLHAICRKLGLQYDASRDVMLARFHELKPEFELKEAQELARLRELVSVHELAKIQTKEEKPEVPKTSSPGLIHNKMFQAIAAALLFIGLIYFAAQAERTDPRPNNCGTLGCAEEQP